MKNRSDLVLAILDRLSVLQAGQPPATEDTQKVDGKIDPLLRELAAIELINVPDVTNIPLELFDSVADVLAERMKTVFPVDPSDIERLTSDAAASMQRLKVITRGRPTYAIVEQEPF